MHSWDRSVARSISKCLGWIRGRRKGDLDDRSLKQYRASSPSSTGSIGYGRYTPTSHSPQHYSRTAGTDPFGTSSCISLSQHTSPTSTFRHHYIPFFKGKDRNAIVM
ncbi:unnamed protein product [Ranitomeya imitator]|uniref:Putative adherens-junction anchoring domain-containing protein n=1 Tax=Ranitomeya imitator TaxID=111125 RepID=A0ABN9KSL5_9NEOB|nr:unnamed protein product [Ranitomeya imitator]